MAKPRRLDWNLDNRLALIATLASILAACSQPLAVPEPTLAPATQRPTSTSTSEPTTTPTPAPSPTPLSSELVWFTPNFGSGDFLDLFAQPESWPSARAQIDVFKFYTQNILDDHCQICGPNSFSALVGVDAFQKLTDWGIAISIEVGAVKEWGCTGTDEFRAADAAIQRVQANGGSVATLAMDEPYIGGQLVADGNTCGYSMEESADITARFIRLVNRVHPDILVGDIEPYPYFTIPELELWLDALEQRGVSLAYFHLDADLVGARAMGRDVGADLQRLSQFLEERQIPFGVIFTANSDWDSRSDCSYFDSTVQWVRAVKAAIGRPQQIIFQSWLGPAADGSHAVPQNLPESGTDSCSHTRLIIQGLELLGD